ncbi:MarR family transcriptional regulator [Nocardia terpenica]|uniref:hypothetical protein n=1 Tax=Nocardia terpenica TaxID=455432 RepID=UPI002FE3312A
MSIDTTTTATESGRSAHENALWAALTANPAATTAELAQAASVPKTTARKILTGWAADQLATRVTDPDDPRSAVRWMLPDTPVSEPETDSPATEIESQLTPAEPARADDTPVPDPVIDPAPTSEAQPDAAATPRDPQPPTTPTTAEAVQPADEHADRAPADVTTPTQPAAVPVVEGVCPTCGRSVPKPRGLQPGALRGLIEDFLREHPGQEFTPGEIAKELKRSSGAVYNALFLLVGKFVAEHTCERPNRFRLHPSQEQQ